MVRRMKNRGSDSEHRDKYIEKKTECVLRALQRADPAVADGASRTELAPPGEEHAVSGPSSARDSELHHESTVLFDEIIAPLFDFIALLSKIVRACLQTGLIPRSKRSPFRLAQTIFAAVHDGSAVCTIAISPS